MVSSARQVAQRAFLTVLLEVARLYCLSTGVKRESTDKDLEAAFKRVSLKAHPDKGGCNTSFQKLIAAREKWQSAGDPETNKVGRPKKDTAAAEIHGVLPGLKSAYRVQSSGVLLTYQRAPGPDGWESFCAWVQDQAQPWKVKYWCATLETCKDGRYHTHLMLQFLAAAERTVDEFRYRGLKPNASTNDLCGEGLCGKKLQQSLDRGFFYVYANKKGTARDDNGKECTAGNYSPAWTEEAMTYQVLGKWAETLWKQYKLTDLVYEDLLFKCRDGVLSRKRNLDVCRQHTESQETRQNESNGSAGTEICTSLSQKCLRHRGG